MANTITVWYNGSALLVNKEVADLKNIPNNYRVKSEEEFWSILGANATHQLKRIALITPIHNKSIESLN
jgi:hypothetical protein